MQCQEIYQLNHVHARFLAHDNLSDDDRRTDKLSYSSRAERCCEEISRDEVGAEPGSLAAVGSRRRCPTPPRKAEGPASIGTAICRRFWGSMGLAAWHQTCVRTSRLEDKGSHENIS